MLRSVVHTPLPAKGRRSCVTCAMPSMVAAKRSQRILLFEYRSTLAWPWQPRPCFVHPKLLITGGTSMAEKPTKADKPSKVEVIKANSDQLRGDLAAGLENDSSGFDEAERAAAQVPRPLPAGKPRRAQGCRAPAAPQRTAQMEAAAPKPGKTHIIHAAHQAAGRPLDAPNSTSSTTTLPTATPTARCASRHASASSFTASSRAISRPRCRN